MTGMVQEYNRLVTDPPTVSKSHTHTFNIASFLLKDFIIFYCVCVGRGHLPEVAFSLLLYGSEDDLRSSGLVAMVFMH